MTKDTLGPDSVLLITGGTGSFGNAVLRRMLDTPIKEIRIFSRDEKKQDDMRKRYRNPKLKFYLGDVRESDSVRAAMRGVDYVFHAAALKQVPSCEFHPMQAVRTNVLSTDKAVYPINAMGTSKAMMEKVAVAKSRESTSTVICVTRYGNVMASRGSVIPLFVRQIKDNLPITLTDPLMTRFMMTLDEAVDLVLYAFNHGSPGEIFVQKAPAATIGVLAEAVKAELGVPNHRVETIGTRHGEKLFEVLLSREEMSSASDQGEYFRVPPDLRDLNYGKFVEQGEPRISKAIEYGSHNTSQLDVEGMRAVLQKVRFMQALAKGEHPDAEE